MKYKLVIFDLDGTLLDTLEDIAQSCNDTLEAFGFGREEEQEYRYHVGSGARKLIENVTYLPSTDPLVDKMLMLFEEIYASQYADNTAPYSGVEEMLVSLQSSGVKLAILSNKPDGFVKDCVKMFLPSFNFEVVLGEIEGMERKPSNDGVDFIVKTLHVNKDEVLFVGDTKIDMQTSVNSKVDGCGVTWGFRDEDELRENGSKYIIHNPLELLEIIE